MKTTDYAGIDYGFGKINMDTENGIRNGVILSNSLEHWDSECEYDSVLSCPECGSEAEDIGTCETCGYEVCEDDYYTHGYYINSEEITAYQNQDGTDIFVTKSKYYTYAQFCSPCAPGACYLENPLSEKNENNKAYCFGHDWFDGGVAPYPVYEVSTNKLVEPTK